MTATVIIKAGGTQLEERFALLSVDVFTAVNRIPRARVRVSAGVSALEAFELSGAETLTIGKDLEIAFRREGTGEQEKVVFKGVIVRHLVQFGRDGEILEVEAKDKAFAMTIGRKNAVFAPTKDSDAITDIVVAAGLTADTEPTELEHEELVQYQASDWDFIVSRAELNGQVVMVEDGKVTTKPLDFLPEGTEHEFTYGVTPCFDFELFQDGAYQPADAGAISWDAENRKASTPSAAEEPSAGGFNVTRGADEGAGAAKKLSSPSLTLVHGGAILQKEREAWAKGRLARRRFALLRGRLSLGGQTDFALLDAVVIDGVSARFAGKALVTGMRHRYGSRGWRTDVEFGVEPEAYVEKVRVADIGANGVIPSASGLQLATVESLEDESGELRVRVKIGALAGADKDLVYARLSQVDAGADRGMVFRPEVGDEVVIGFVNQDPRFPVILGSLHSSGQAPPDDWMPAEENERRGIRTKGGSELTFVDGESVSISIRTPNGNMVVLDEGAKGITIEDQKKNKLILNKDGVQLISKGDLTIEASGSIKIKGSSVDIE